MDETFYLPCLTPREAADCDESRFLYGNAAVYCTSGGHYWQHRSPLFRPTREELDHKETGGKDQTYSYILSGLFQGMAWGTFADIQLPEYVAQTLAAAAIAVLLLTWVWICISYSNPATRNRCILGTLMAIPLGLIYGIWLLGPNLHDRILYLFR
jgi:hypothetical protein